VKLAEESSMKLINATSQGRQGRSNWMHAKSSEVSIIGTHPSEITPQGYFTGQAPMRSHEESSTRLLGDLTG